MHTQPYAYMYMWFKLMPYLTFKRFRKSELMRTYLTGMSRFLYVCGETERLVQCTKRPKGPQSPHTALELP